MNSCIYKAKLFHERLEPRKNSFRYSIYMMYLDLDELDELAKNHYILSYNKRNILSFYDDDHFKFLKSSNENANIISMENIKIDKEKYVNKTTLDKIKILAKDLNL